MDALFNDTGKRQARRLRRLKRKKGSKVHAAVDTLGHLLALKVTAANEQERAQVADLAQAVQKATGQNVEVGFVDHGYTGEEPAQAAAQQGMRLIVVKLPEARKGSVLLPKRWVVERSFAWAARFRRLAKDYERLPSSVAGLHWLAFLILMLNAFFHQSVMTRSSEEVLNCFAIALDSRSLDPNQSLRPSRLRINHLNGPRRPPQEV